MFLIVYDISLGFSMQTMHNLSGIMRKTSIAKTTNFVKYRILDMVQHDENWSISRSLAAIDGATDRVLRLHKKVCEKHRHVPKVRNRKLVVDHHAAVFGP